MPIAGTTNGELGPAKSGSKKITVTGSQKRVRATPESKQGDGFTTCPPSSPPGKRRLTVASKDTPASRAVAEEFARRAKRKPAKSMFSGVPVGSIGPGPTWLQQQ